VLRTVAALAAVLLSQAQPVKITNPANQAKAATTTTVGSKEGLDVNCISGCSGAGAGAGGSSGGGGVIDGGDVGVTQRPGTGQGGWVDGGFLDGIKNPVVVTNSNLDVLLSTRTKPSDQQHGIIDSSALPSGAATEITLLTLLTTNTFTARLGTLGQKTMSGSAPVVFASDQTPLAVTGTFFQSVQPVSASALPLPTGAATDSTVGGLLTNTQLRASPLPVSGPATNAELRATPLNVDAFVAFDGGLFTAQIQDGGVMSINNFPGDGGAPATDATEASNGVALGAIRSLLEQILAVQQQQAADLARLH
jgi:hypothetical protein